MLVKESLSFTRGNEPKDTLGIGQRYLIEKWLEEMHIKYYTINDDLTINVFSSLYLADKNLTEIPEYIQFNQVKFHFNCQNNKLTSLRGCPNMVRKNFYCDSNLLTSLEGCPKYVGGFFQCFNNPVRFDRRYINTLCDVKSKKYYT